ncbi:hypothetical protein EG68_08851 [Paragonimus skrjabini miyazakii]|uniref:Chromatin modification-related protein MEAF6 n=1 Tax=Paragonimus skrjabini miyazakii TaxID=59628 RepID=A0A8S9YKE8_9TREM|nr:hypothetical protein EG68_08851 [Paragonimus skrjabini miyazakii]
MPTQPNSKSTSSVFDLKADLCDLVRKRKALTDNLAALERQIYLFEGSYLDDTAPYGNIINGWDRYLLSAGVTTNSVSSNNNNLLAAPTRTSGDKRVRKFRDSDRLFSRSSVTSIASLNAQNDAPNAHNDGSVSGQLIADPYGGAAADVLSNGQSTPQFPRTSKIFPPYGAGPTGKKKKKLR